MNFCIEKKINGVQGNMPTISFDPYARLIWHWGFLKLRQDYYLENQIDKLAKGGQASGRFVPKEISPQEKPLLPKAIMHYTNELCKKLEKLSEEELDTYLLPHPLLGKLTFREMLYFTAYHAEHHHLIAKRDLGK
jgi:DinB superfamily